MYAVQVVNQKGFGNSDGQYLNAPKSRETSTYHNPKNVTSYLNPKGLGAGPFHQSTFHRADPLKERIKYAILMEKEQETSTTKDKLAILANLGIPGLDHVVDVKRSHLGRLFWACVTFGCIALCVYQIVNRVLVYLSYPVSADVSISKNSTVKFPQITLCPVETEALIRIKMEYLKSIDEKLKTTTNLCSIQLPDLVGFKNLTAKEVWDLTRISQFQAVKFEESAASNKTVIVSEKDVILFGGTCKVFRIKKEAEYQGTETHLKIVRGRHSDGCGEYAYWVTAEMDGEYPDFKTSWPLPEGSNMGFAMQVKQFRGYDSPRNPCVDLKTATECYRDCINANMEKGVTCSLPFMDNDDLPQCKTSDEAKTTYDNAHSVLLKMDARTCNCTPKCERNLYSMSRESFEFNTAHTTVSFYFSDNHFELVQESRSYVLVAFLCDIGGNLGLYLGLSVLSLFEIFQSVYEVNSN